MSNTNLPKNWLFTTLGKVVDYGKTVQVEPEQIDPSTWVLELEDLEKDTSRLLNRKTFAERNSKSSKNLFEKGDILYGKLRPYLNKVIIADQPGCCTTEIIPIKVPKTLNNRYLFYWLKSPTFLHYVAGQSHGLNMPRLGTAAAKAAPFVLAPISVQSMVADRLDHLLARVDSCRAHLDRAAAAIKRFRQSVLNAAVTGQLTYELNLTMNKNLEQIADFLSKQSNLKKNETDKLTVSLDYDLPPHWCTAPLGLLISACSYGSSQKSAKTGLIPVLRMGNIQSGILDWEDLVYTSDQTEIDKYLLEPGDVLFNRTNSPELVGKTAMYKEGAPKAIYAGYLIRVKTLPALNPQFLTYCLNSSYGRHFSWQVKTDGVSQSNINASKLCAFPTPICSRTEQDEIVRRAEALFQKADEMESKLTTARERVDNLTASILAKAFRGELL